jgi:hypothetical protein
LFGVGEIAFGRVQKHMGHFMKECLVRELCYGIDRDLVATRLCGQVSYVA